VIFSSLSNGEYIGEMALDGGPRSVSVRALEPTLCAVVTCDTVRDHFAEYPDFAAELISRMIGRIRVLTQTTRGLALMGVYQRMSSLFERLAIDENTGIRVIGERMTHQQIAGYVGASREMVSKVLKELTTGGYVSIRDRQIVILKPLPPGW
jgi:CRP/FNR family transcriptional regulator, cyclic AMP receptor protein